MVDAGEFLGACLIPPWGVEVQWQCRECRGSGKVPYYETYSLSDALERISTIRRTSASSATYTLP